MTFHFILGANIFGFICIGAVLVHKNQVLDIQRDTYTTSLLCTGNRSVIMKLQWPEFFIMQLHL